ncbi:hypothetical protein DAI22_12g184600 [Oryza sativa Japonica Group]|jgi:hypothetical protein|nr:hypothetical protein DAI22_12g184600 [Oryza sativa Japonica Group]
MIHPAITINIQTNSQMSGQVVGTILVRGNNKATTVFSQACLPSLAVSPSGINWELINGEIICQNTYLIPSRRLQNKGMCKRQKQIQSKSDDSRTIWSPHWLPTNDELKLWPGLIAHEMEF